MVGTNYNCEEGSIDSVYALMTSDEAAERMKAMREKLERVQFGLTERGVKQCVYFLHDPKSGAIKIGVSEKVGQRVSSLKCGTPNDISLLGTVVGTPMLERLLHRFLAHFQIQGEWFKATPTIIDFVKALVEMDEARFAAVREELDAATLRNRPTTSRRHRSASAPSMG